VLTVDDADRLLKVLDAVMDEIEAAK